MARSLYPRKTEPDLRQEMINTLDGKFPEIGKKQKAVLRTISTTACPCVDPLTKESDKDHYCPVCMGEGYLWSETYIDVYKVIPTGDTGSALTEQLQSPGLINKPLVVFYTRSAVNITKRDKIVELVLDKEGSPVSPLQRRAIYRIGILFDMRSDHGRLEFWKVDGWEEDVKFLNGPEG